MESLSCLSHEERTARLQLRTKESEIAVKQLHVCIEVIRQKSREQCMASEVSVHQAHNENGLVMGSWCA